MLYNWTIGFMQLHGGMPMKAKVKVINLVRGMYAAEIEGQGEFVIFELLDTAEPEIDDFITHPDFYAMGCETFKNVTQSCEIEVSIENVCGANQVKELCFL